AAAQRACRTTRGVRTCPPPLEREATTRLPVLGAGLAIRRHGSRTLSRPAGVSHSRRSLRQTIARPLGSAVARSPVRCRRRRRLDRRDRLHPARLVRYPSRASRAVAFV